MDTVLVLNAAATLVMVGVIWVVQVVVYPQFARVGADAFPAYHAGHVRRMGFVVGPVMPVEALTSVLLVAWPPDGVPRAAAAAGVTLLAVAWALTAFAAVPAHRRLARGFDDATHRALLRMNGLRVAVWTGRGVIVAVLLATA